MLDPNLPGTFYEEKENEYEAHIKYVLQVELKSLDNHIDDLENNYEFVVRELLKH